MKFIVRVLFDPSQIAPAPDIVAVGKALIVTVTGWIVEQPSELVPLI